MFWMLSQPLVTVGRLAIDWYSAGKLVFSAASTCAGVIFSVVARNATSFGSSAVTDDSGIAFSSANVCGKFFLIAAAALAGVVCNCLAAYATSTGTSAAPPPDGSMIGFAMSTLREMML